MRRLILAAGVVGGVAAIFAARPTVGRPMLGREHSAPTVTAPEIETEAVTGLKRMGSYLRELKSFQVDANISREEVLTDGQKLQFDSRVSALVQRPNRLRLSLRSDRKERTYFFDGKTLTIWAPRLKYYATVSAPPTIVALADTLEEKFDLELPLVDLFRWGMDGANDSLTAARDIGPAVVGGVTCEQYAFRQDGLDWQVWIQLGDNPLPRKVVITTLTDEARPQHTVEYTWNLAPSFDSSTFVFDKPIDSHRIAIVGDDVPLPTANGKSKSKQK